MMNFFLLPLVLVAVTLLPFWFLYVWRHVSVEVFTAKTTYEKVLSWIGLVLMSALFLVSGTVVLELWIALLTEGSVKVG